MGAHIYVVVTQRSMYKKKNKVLYHKFCGTNLNFQKFQLNFVSLFASKHTFDSLLCFFILFQMDELIIIKVKIYHTFEMDEWPRFESVGWRLWSQRYSFLPLQNSTWESRQTSLAVRSTWSWKSNYWTTQFVYLKVDCIMNFLNWKSISFWV